MKRNLIANLFLSLFAFWQYVAAAPIPYSGKVAINGVNFQGGAQFTFALRDANGTTHWRNGVDANSSINVPVDRGHYVVLLGGQGMIPLPSELFLDYPELYLEVKFYRPDTQEWLHLEPDQRITSAPHALSADLAQFAIKAEEAKRVEPGAITKSMLAHDVLADLNATVVVSQQNNAGHVGSITREMLPWDVLQDLNGTIPRSRLSADVLDDLNQSIKAITREMLPWDVLQDLNGTIPRSRLSADVLDDLNQSIKAITREMLPWDVLQDLNGTIPRSRLSADVLDDLNQSIPENSITLAQLAPEVTSKLDQNATHGIKEFANGQTTSLSTNWTVPNHVRSLYVEIWGGGGGGGRSNNNQYSEGAGGGGSGGYVRAFLSVTPGEVLTMIRGVGGFKASQDLSSGADGNTTKISSSMRGDLVVATGGTGGGVKLVGGNWDSSPGIGGTGTIIHGSGITRQGNPGDRDQWTNGSTPSWGLPGGESIKGSISPTYPNYSSPATHYDGYGGGGKGAARGNSYPSGTAQSGKNGHIYIQW